METELVEAVASATREPELLQVLLGSAPAIVGAFALLQLLLVKLTRTLKVDTMVLVLVGSCVVSILYTVFTRYVPEAAQIEVQEFVTSVFATQWVIYEAWKRRGGVAKLLSGK